MFFRSWNHLLRNPLPKPALRFTSQHQSRTMTTLPPRNPIIFILGATGTGKSDLAVQIAQYLSQASTQKDVYSGAEIINADAMQLYRGLPIITNKITAAEQKGIPHHLLDHIGLEEEPWAAHHYRIEADKIIADIRQRGKVPIVVGGTSYYVSVLLFTNASLDTEKEEQRQATETAGFGKDAAQTWPILEADTDQIYAKLCEVDPEAAATWHPRDRRRIQRSLEIYLRTGKKASEWYKEQQAVVSQEYESDSENAANGQQKAESQTNSLRYDAVVFWLEAENNVLRDRLDRRVDRMLENGLLSEAQKMDGFLQEMQSKLILVDKSKGVWVSIGYKEMEPWIEALHKNDLPEKDIDRLKNSGIEEIKNATRKYARRQRVYVRGRFSSALSTAKATDRLFLLDCTNVEQWQDKVQEPALKIAQSFLRGEQLPEPAGLSQLAQTTLANTAGDDAQSDRFARRCETCDKILMSEAQWTNHINGRSHKKILQGIRNRELNEARRKAAQSVRETENV